MRAIYCYLTDSNEEAKKAKGTNRCTVKRTLGAMRLENKINQLENNRVNRDSLRENHKELKKKSKLLLKSQQGLWSEKHIIFTEEVNKISSSANNYKRIQSLDPVETYANGTSKEYVRKKEESKYNYIIIRYNNTVQKWLILVMLLKKT